MTDTSGYFFYGIMVIEGEKWKAQGKFDQDSFGGALMKAEEISLSPGCEGVKVMRIPMPGSQVKPKKM